MREGVFLGVHDAGLKRRIDLGERHGRRIRPIVLEHLHPPDSARHSQLDAFQILGLDDRSDVVGDVAKAVLPDAEDAHAFGRQPVEERALHRFALGDLFHVGAADDEVGHLEDAEFLLRRAHDGRRQKHLRRADLDAAHHLLVAAELARMENFDLHFAFERGVGSLGVFIRGDREK